MRRQRCAWRRDIGFCGYKHVAKGTSVRRNLQRYVFRYPVRKHVEDHIFDRIGTLQHVLGNGHVTVEGLVRADVEIYVFEAVRVSVDDSGLDRVEPRTIANGDDVRLGVDQSIELQIGEQSIERVRPIRIIEQPRTLLPKRRPGGELDGPLDHGDEHNYAYCQHK
jgi:hypothetical protein